jgi:hypothetical protein
LALQLLARFLGRSASRNRFGFGWPVPTEFLGRVAVA